MAIRLDTRAADFADLDRAGLRVTGEEIAAALDKCERHTLDALSFARDRIEAFHRRQMPQDDRFTDALGVELGARWTAGRGRRLGWARSSAA